MTPPSTLSDSVSSHPVFVANQLLSFGDLNNLVDYLDHQTRLTRLCEIGAGVICGFEPRWTAAGLEISGGCGVTSEGFLITRGTGVYGRYQAVDINRGKFVPRETDLTVPAWELIENPLLGENGTGEEVGESLDEADAAARVVVLLLECDELANEFCADDCDEKGTQRRFVVRPLLLDEGTARGLLSENYLPDNPERSLESLFHDHYQLPELYLERFGYAETETEGGREVKLALTEITSYDSLLDYYARMIEQGGERVAAALGSAHRAFSLLSAAPRPAALPALPPGRADGGDVAANRPFEIQYAHDHLRDLVMAYDELREVAFDVMDVCRTPVRWFPKHLFLGRPLFDGAPLPVPPSVERTPYVRPPTFNGNQERVPAAHLYYERLRRLIQHFEVPSTEEIRITPSRWSAARLSARAIPFYYDPDEGLHTVWSGDHHRRRRDQQIHGYHRMEAPDGGDGGTRLVVDPLVYDHEAHDFYRIEGHIGHTLDHAFGAVEELRRCYNLPFDMVALKVGGEVSEELIELDCEWDVIQTMYRTLQTDLACTLDTRFEGSESTAVARLREITQIRLADFDLEEARILFEAVSREGGVDAAWFIGCDQRAFEEIHKLFTQRKEEVLERHLFHKFAESHPGVDHGAGVPRGGTFILAYVDTPPSEDEVARRVQQQVDFFESIGDIVAAEAWRENGPDHFRRTLITQTVAADFYLPYSCCSDCAPIAYVIARPKPTLLIDRTIFCSNDTDRHAFIVDPPGGSMAGAGTQRDDATGNFFFVPSDVPLGSGPIVISYTADQATTELTLTVLAAPSPSFPTLPTDVCEDDGLLQLVSVSGTDDEIRIAAFVDGAEVDAIVLTDGMAHLDTARVTPGDVVDLVHAVRDSNGCEGEATHRLTVHPLPDAEFDLVETHCIFDGPIILRRREQPGTTSTFSGPGVQGDIFVPDGFEFDSPTEDVEITHTVLGPGGCSRSMTKTLTLVVPVGGAFALTALPPVEEEANFRISDITISTNPAWESPDFVYEFSWIGGRFTRTDQSDFEFSIPFSELRLLDGEPLEVSLTVNHFGCTQSPPFTAEVTPIFRPEEEDERDDEREDERPEPDPDIPETPGIPTGPGGGTVGSGPGGGVVIGVSVGEEAAELLDNRRVLRGTQLERIAERDPGLESTPHLGRAMDLVEGSGQRPIGETIEGFDTLMTSMVRGYRQTGAERQEGYRGIAEAAALVVLDRLASTDSTDREREMVRENLDRLEAVGVELPRLRRRWLTTAVRGALPEEGLEIVAAVFS